jgi:HSP20 family protein
MAFRDLIPWSRQENRLPTSAGGALDRDDYHPIYSLHREMNRLFDDVLHGFGASGGGIGRSLGWPQVELAETDEALRVIAELPGMDEKDVELVVEEGVLTLRGEKRSEFDDKERGYSERSFGRFERRIGLPRGIERDKASATFRNGVLTVTLPRSAAANENIRRIPVNTQAA